MNGNPEPTIQPRMEAVAPARTMPFDPRRKSPLLASVLSLMPGLGQIYVGYYQRGFTHILVVAGLIALMASETLPTEFLPLAGIFLAFFFLYNIIDAGRRAAFYNQAVAGGEQIQMPGDMTLPTGGGSLAGGLALMAVGFILFLHTRFDISLRWVEQWWPAIPLAFGAYLVYSAVQERNKSD